MQVTAKNSDHNSSRGVSALGAIEAEVDAQFRERVSSIDAHLYTMDASYSDYMLVQSHSQDS